MLKRILLGSFTTLVLAACGSLNANQAQVRIVHASPDAGAVDVYVGSSKVLTGATYTQASAFTGFTQGNLAIKVCAAGSTTSCPINTTLNAAAGKYYTVLAVGTVAGGNLQALVAQDDITAPTVSGQFKLRVIHAAPAATPVDVYVTAPPTDITPATTAPAISNFAYQTATTPYIGVPSGSYRFRVTAATTKNVVIDSGLTGFPLVSGKIYTAIAVNPVAGVTNGLILLFDY